MKAQLILADISGHAIITVVVTIIVVSIVYWVLTMVVDRIVEDPLFKKVLHAILILGAGIFLVDAILRLVGHPFISW